MARLARSARRHAPPRDPRRPSDMAGARRRSWPRPPPERLPWRRRRRQRGRSEHGPLLALFVDLERVAADRRLGRRAPLSGAAPALRRARLATKQRVWPSATPRGGRREHRVARRMGAGRVARTRSSDLRRGGPSRTLTSRPPHRWLHCS